MTRTCLLKYTFLYRKKFKVNKFMYLCAKNEYDVFRFQFFFFFIFLYSYF